MAETVLKQMIQDPQEFLMQKQMQKKKPKPVKKQVKDYS